VAVARALFKLGYRYAEIRAELDGERVRFASRRIAPGPLPAACAFEYAPRGTVAHAVPGTLAHFLIERYILYAADAGKLYQGRVHHEACPVQAATIQGPTQDLVQAAGLPAPRGEPLAHYASEVDVEVFPLREL
jgi:uncharacterized protein